MNLVQLIHLTLGRVMGSIQESGFRCAARVGTLAQCVVVPLRWPLVAITFASIAAAPVGAQEPIVGNLLRIGISRSIDVGLFLRVINGQFERHGGRSIIIPPPNSHFSPKAGDEWLLDYSLRRPAGGPSLAVIAPGTQSSVALEVHQSSSHAAIVWRSHDRWLGSGIVSPGASAQSKASHLALQPLLVIVSTASARKSLLLKELKTLLSNAAPVANEKLVEHVHMVGRLGRARELAESYELPPPGAHVVLHNSIVSVINAVAANRNAIGLVAAGMSDLSDRVRALPIGIDCGMQSLPSPSAVRLGIYPLVRELAILAPSASRLPMVRQLIAGLRAEIDARAKMTDGLVSPRSDFELDIVTRERLLGWLVQQLSENRAEHRRYAQLLKEATLLGFVQFGHDRSDLDESGRGLVAAIARRIRLIGGDRQAIWVTGFADLTGTAERNAALSSQRADVVVAGLKDNGLPEAAIRRLPMDTAGAIGCNTTGNGRAANRRAEIWVGRE